MKPSNVIDLRQAMGLLEAGRIAEAEALARVAVKHAPKNALVHALLGQIAEARGQLDDAARHYRKSLSLDARQVMTHIALGQVRTNQGRFRDAVTGFEKALRLQPDEPHTVAALADALDKRGDPDRALELLEPSIDRGDESPQMAAVYVTVQMNRGEHAAAVRVAQRHLARPDLDPGVQQLMGFALGRSLEALHRYDESFEAYERANRARPSRFDAPGFVQRIDDLINIYSGSRLELLSRSTNESEMPIFIVGMPRSGTTLVERIIAAHPQARGAGEIIVLHNLIAELPVLAGSDQSYPGCMLDVEPDDANRLARMYLEGIRGFSRGARRVTDKNLENWRHVGLIALLLPKARFIHCTRDPLDTCFSCFTSSLSPLTNPWASDLNSIGLAYQQYQRLMAHWKDQLDLRMMDVSYEALVEDPTFQTRRLIDFTGLEWDDACLRHHDDAEARSGTGIAPTLSYNQVRQPVYRTAQARSRPYSDHLDILQRRLANQSGT